MATLLQDCLYKQMESQSDMCDVTLVIGGVEMKAHWCVLAVCPFFESVYKSDMKEKLAGNITLECGDQSATRAAVRFLYTGTVEITDENIREIFQASDFFQIEQLTELCGEFLKCVSITVKNCVGLCNLGNLYSLDSVCNTALKFMNGHLPEVLEKDEALTLTTDSIIDMITNETLRYVSVEQFFGFLVKWVEYDLLQREEYFCDLFSNLNLSRVTNTFLTSKIEIHSFVKNCVKCQTHLTDHKDKLKAGEICQETEEKEVVLIVGGKKRDSVYAYIIIENRWVQLPPLPRAVTRPLVASDGKQALFVMETCRIFDDKQYIYQFVPGSKEWVKLNVKLPAGSYGHYVREISYVGDKVLILVINQVTNANGCNYRIMELNKTNLNFEGKCDFFAQGKYPQYHWCTAMGRYMCVCVKNASYYSSGHNFAKLVYYDAEEDVLVNSFDVPYFPHSRMYARKNEIVLAHPGSTDVRSFNLDSRMWRNQCREFCLPFPEDEAKQTHHCHCYHEGQLYLFGRINSTTKLSDSSVTKLNIDTQQCDSMENLPEALMDPDCCVMTLPTDLVRCHLDCPHCEILRSQHR